MEPHLAVGQDAVLADVRHEHHAAMLLGLQFLDAPLRLDVAEDLAEPAVLAGLDVLAGHDDEMMIEHRLLQFFRHVRLDRAGQVDARDRGAERFGQARDLDSHQRSPCYSAAAKLLPKRSFSRGITSFAISSIERLDKPASTQSWPA